MLTIERRAFAVHELRVAAPPAGQDGPRTIEGYAALFNVRSELIDGEFVEQIAPGAFTDAIQQDDVRALFNHDPNFVLGRNTAGTLRLEEDQRGLRISLDPPATSWASDLLVSMQRGDVTQMSFGFITLDDAWETENGIMVRTLRKVRLFDVSPVTYPAYPATEVGVRSLQEIADAGREAVTPAPPPAVVPDLRSDRLRVIRATL